MSKIVYVVEMLRYGEREEHSYVEGVYSDLKLAEYNAKLHMLDRANKYSAEIRQEIIDHDPPGRGLVMYISEVYETEEDLEGDIKSREDYLKYRKNKDSKSNYKLRCGDVEINLTNVETFSHT